MRMFDHLFTVETLLVVLSVWGAGVAFYLLKTYLQRVNVYHTRVQNRLMKIGSQPLRQGERPNSSV
jgi:positive regulator of sigma E activity